MSTVTTFGLTARACMTPLPREAPLPAHFTQQRELRTNRRPAKTDAEAAPQRRRQQLLRSRLPATTDARVQHQVEQETDCIDYRSIFSAERVALEKANRNQTIFYQPLASTTVPAQQQQSLHSHHATSEVGDSASVASASQKNTSSSPPATGDNHHNSTVGKKLTKSEFLRIGSASTQPGGVLRSVATNLPISAAFGTAARAVSPPPLPTSRTLAAPQSWTTTGIVATPGPLAYDVPDLSRALKPKHCPPPAKGVDAADPRPDMVLTREGLVGYVSVSQRCSPAPRGQDVTSLALAIGCRVPRSTSSATHRYCEYGAEEGGVEKGLPPPPVFTLSSEAGEPCDLALYGMVGPGSRPPTAGLIPTSRPLVSAGGLRPLSRTSTLLTAKSQQQQRFTVPATLRHIQRRAVSSLEILAREEASATGGRPATSTSSASPPALCSTAETTTIKELAVGGGCSSAALQKSSPDAADPVPHPAGGDEQQREEDVIDRRVLSRLVLEDVRQRGIGGTWMGSKFRSTGTRNAVFKASEERRRKLLRIRDSYGGDDIPAALLELVH